RLTLGIRAIAEIDSLERDWPRWPDHLMRHAVNQPERRAQRFVPRHQLAQGSFERTYIQTTPQARSQGDVVCRSAVRLQLVEEPQPLLGIRGGQQRLLARLATDAILHSGQRHERREPE